MLPPQPKDRAASQLLFDILKDEPLTSPEACKPAILRGEQHKARSCTL